MEKSSWPGSWNRYDELCRWSAKQINTSFGYKYLHTFACDEIRQWTIGLLSIMEFFLNKEKKYSLSVSWIQHSLIWTRGYRNKQTEGMPNVSKSEDKLKLKRFFAMGWENSSKNLVGISDLINLRW